VSASLSVVGGRSGPIVGIDLGTTNSLVSVLQGGRPVVLPNAVGSGLTPSAVSIDDRGEVLVGAPALERLATAPERTATAFKRDMGTDRRYTLGDKTFSAPELSALVLKSLRADAEAALGARIGEAVITVPAYFDEVQRRATRDAAAIAGLRADRIINEPTAAALAYGLHQRTNEVRAIVLDLGGGTFDVTVLDIMEGVIEIQSTAGDSRLGGEDFVDALVARAAAKAGVTREEVDARAWARLRVAAESAKRRLSAAPEATITLPGWRPDGSGFSCKLERAEAEEAWRALLERMRAPIVRALRDARRTPDRIEKVLLVGGATRMPCVIALAQQMFQREPSRELPPDEAVALGAAVQAGLKAQDRAVDDMVVTDVAPFSMGIAVATPVGRELVTGSFVPVLERGTVIPTSRVKPFSTVADGQTSLKIEVFQGEHALCRDNRKLGEFVVGGLPPAPAGAAAVNVRFTYDINGLLEVEATIRDTGAKTAIVLEQTPGRLSKKEVEAAQKEMERLKLHPRDALPNALALARAEARFVELTGARREQVGEAIAVFRGVLETHDPDAIASVREKVLAILDAPP
jgi:molecular chaperone HscC